MALEEARAGLNRTSASPPPLPARAPFEPAPFKTPAPTLGPALESNLSLWQTCSEKRLLDHDNDRSACICCVAASNQHDLHLDPVPLEPSLGPNRAVVRWLIWAVERSAAHERVPSGRATMPLMHPMMSMDRNERGCQAGAHIEQNHPKWDVIDNYEPERHIQSQPHG